jgi:thiamine-monophosphate kinase
MSTEGAGAALGEFALIDRYFRPLGIARRADVEIGIGDDGALLIPPPGQRLVAAIDTLVAGRHFLPDCDPAAIGHRALAVNLSDLAAMGADPAWCLLALTLPAADDAFLRRFAQGFGALADIAGIALVGGDTTAGPLTVTVQVLGFVPPGLALTRSGGAAGDLVFVSGTPGDAAGGLRVLQDSPAARDLAPAPTQLVHRFLYPEPRLALGRALRGIASACIDVSDGLAADLAHVARASGCGAQLQVEDLPLSEALRERFDADTAVDLALRGGDDYELCFTVPPGRLPELAARIDAARTPVRCIGALVRNPGLRVSSHGKAFERSLAGFDHFAWEG